MKKYALSFFQKNADVSILARFKANCLEKNAMLLHAKTYFFPHSTNLAQKTELYLVGLLLGVEDTGHVTIECYLTNLLSSLFSLFFCPFVPYCFASTVSSTPSRSHLVVMTALKCFQLLAKFQGLDISPQSIVLGLYREKLRSGAFIFDTSLKSIDGEGLEESCTGTSQVRCQILS